MHLTFQVSTVLYQFISQKSLHYGGIIMPSFSFCGRAEQGEVLLIADSTLSILDMLLKQVVVYDTL